MEIKILLIQSINSMAVSLVGRLKFQSRKSTKQKRCSNTDQKGHIVVL